MEPSSPAAQPPAPAGTVLCIEDHAASMALVEALLERYPGVRLLKAATGREGVRLALEELPDLVLLDMHLPDIGGIEVVRALNAQIADRLLRVVLLTGDSFSIDVVKAMSLGAQEYWRKPLDLQRVTSALVRLLGEPPRGRAVPAGGEPPTRRA
jgi:CheY-like chemotaxis protein